MGVVWQVVDTVLGKLYTESGETTDLLALIDGPNDVVLQELEPVLVKSGRFDALCRLHRTQGLDDELLAAWSRLVTLGFCGHNI
jgi:vacuolar protein sorting-associated protein 3